MDDAYLIDVRGHEEGFGDKEHLPTYDFVNVIGENWSFLLGPPVENCEPDTVLSPEGHAQARRSGLRVPTVFKGRVYLPGGYMSDGTSQYVVALACDILNKARDLHDYLSENRLEVLDWLERESGTRPEQLRLRIDTQRLFFDGEVALVALGTGAVFAGKSWGHFRAE